MLPAPCQGSSPDPRQSPRAALRSPEPPCPDIPYSAREARGALPWASDSPGRVRVSHTGAKTWQRLQGRGSAWTLARDRGADASYPRLAPCWGEGLADLPELSYGACQLWVSSSNLGSLCCHLVPWAAGPPAAPLSAAGVTAFPPR